MFGSPPLDGKIYCKYCNEYLCDEDYSSLEGFSDDKPVKSNEALINRNKERPCIFNNYDIKYIWCNFK